MPTKPPPAPKKPSTGKIAYEQQRAAKAGKSHDEWLKTKAKSVATAAAVKKPEAKLKKKPGLIDRLLEKAHKPL